MPHWLILKSIEVEIKFNNPWQQQQINSHQVTRQPVITPIPFPLP